MCTQMVLNQISHKMLESYQNIYGKNLVKVYLYGSYARNDFNSDSDIDYVALVKGERQTIQNQLEDVWTTSCRLGLDYDIIISPMAIPIDEFVKLKSILPFYQNIEREGVEING